MQSPRASRWAVITSILFVAACSDARVTAVPSAASDADLYQSIATVTVDPSTVSATVGDSGGFTATARDARGRTLSGVVFTWSSSNSGVVAVRSNGFAVATAAGSAKVVASARGKNGSAAVTVVAPATPPTTPPPAPPAITVASVDVSPGTASGGVNDSAQFTATARDSSGNAISGRTVTWSSTNTSVVVVSASGMGRGVGGGSAQILATIDGVVGRSDITVTGSAPVPPPAPPAPAPVASVSIAPSSVSINTGASTQLSVTLRDASGNVLTGRSVTWASTNSLVAGLSGTGLVMGLAAGSATITATSEGVSGGTSVTVSLLPPPPPPPSSGWPNMPGTYSVITNQAFDPLALTGWQLIWNDYGYGSITSDATAPFSASSVYQVKYPAGFAAGSAPATQVYGMGGKRNVYVGMWWKANANWEGHSSNVNKLQFLFPNNGGGDMYMAVYGPPGGPYELRTALQFVGADTRDWLRPNVGSGNVTMGDWHRIEWLVEYNTSGANGIVRFWLDGALVGDYRDVSFPTTGFDEYKLSPTWGGMGGNKTQTDYFWFDHVTISSR